MSGNSRYIPVLLNDRFYRIHYKQWGNSHSKRVLICAHGLTRNATDFDFIAEALSDEFRVISIDFPGRGKSDWLDNKLDYNFDTYVKVSSHVIARSGAKKVSWLGTSMGGLVGMHLASIPESPIRRMVINDVGPVIPDDAMERIKGYLGIGFKFQSIDHLEQHLRIVHAPFGELTDQQWQHMAKNSALALDEGGYICNYDPDIAEPFKHHPDNEALWQLWDKINCPVGVLHGAESDILLAETTQEMQQRGPKTDVISLPDIGHAPALMNTEQVDIVRRWLTP